MRVLVTTLQGWLVNWFEPNKPPFYWLVIVIVVAYAAYFLSVPDPKRLGGTASSQLGKIVSVCFSVAGGVLILVDGLVTTAIRQINFNGPNDLLVLFAAIGYAQSLIVLAITGMPLLMPNRHESWGLVIILFSVASIMVGGGFILGSILGSIGGALVMTWESPARNLRMPVGGGTMQPAHQSEPRLPGQLPR